VARIQTQQELFQIFGEFSSELRIVWIGEKPLTTMLKWNPQWLCLQILYEGRWQQTVAIFLPGSQLSGGNKNEDLAVPWLAEPMACLEFHPIAGRSLGGSENNKVR
jgi:hypothetical protein